MSDDTYNGWSNRETWAINLHLGNNVGDYLYWRATVFEIVEECTEDHEGGNTPAEEAHIRLADALKEWTEEVFISVTGYDAEPTQEARMFVADVGSWWRADFDEIAQNLLADVEWPEEASA